MRIVCSGSGDYDINVPPLDGVYDQKEEDQVIIYMNVEEVGGKEMRV